MIGHFLKYCANNFQNLSIAHLYRENNALADSLSKEAICLPEFKLVMEVHANREVNYY
jgi:hypothetical protein